MKSSVRYLQEKFDAVKHRNPRFTLRGLALKLNLKSHSHLSRILNGEKPIPINYLPVLTEVFRLTKAESSFFECLIMLDRSVKEEEKIFYEKRLRKIKKKSNIQFDYTNQSHFLSDPLYPILLELTETSDFSLDFDWVKKRLPMKISKREIHEAVQYLIEINLLTYHNEKLVRTYEHIKTIDDKHDKIVNQYHQTILQYATRALETCPIKNRMINSFTLPVDFKKIDEIKNKIREYTEELISEIEADSGKGNEVYQFNMNFFPITNIKENLQ